MSGEEVTGSYELRRLLGVGSGSGGTQVIISDRLGSVVKKGTQTYRYYPYGQEIGGATANDTAKYATYTRDAWSGLDYAMNRFYKNEWGRFTSPDPYQASGGVADPGSWNRYAYVGGDPVNFGDPSGLARGAFNCTSDFCITVTEPMPVVGTIPADVIGSIMQRQRPQLPNQTTQRDILEDMFDVANSALSAYASAFAKRLREGDIGEECMKDIVALEITPDAWADTLDSLSILDGIGSKDSYYTALPVGSPERATALARNLSIGSNFSQGSGIVAISSVNDNRVWIDPRRVNPGDWGAGHSCPN